MRSSQIAGPIVCESQDNAKEALLKEFMATPNDNLKEFNL
jgi:hypothetical protein